MKNRSNTLAQSLVISFLLLPLGLFAQTDVPPGTVGGEWTAEGSPYRILGDVLVPLGESLIIRSGVEVHFTEAYELNVNGNFEVRGTETDPVVFEIAPGVSAAWKGLELRSAPLTQVDSIIIEYANFKQAHRFDNESQGTSDEDIGFANSGGALRISGRKGVRVSHCFFTDNTSTFGGPAIGCTQGTEAIISYSDFVDHPRSRRSGAIDIWDSKVDLIGNYFTGNSGFNGTCLRIVGLLTEVRIIDCRFVENGHDEATKVAGVILARDSKSLELSGNEFIRNHANSYGGAIEVFSTDQVIITGNLFQENEVIFSNLFDINEFASAHSGAVSCSNCVVRNNIFVGNRAPWGGAIRLGLSSILENNLFYNNHAEVSGGAILLMGDAPDVINNIFWGNTSMVAGDNMFLATNQANISNNIFEGGEASWHTDEMYSGDNPISASVGNLTSDPQFMDTAALDFRLTAASPAINAGTNETTGPAFPEFDFYGQPRIIGDTIDIGPHEYGRTTVGVPNLYAHEFLELYPNPARRIVNVVLPEAALSPNLVELYDHLGRIVLVQKQGLVTSANTLTLTLPNGLPSGKYWLRITAGGLFYAQTLLVKK